MTDLERPSDRNLIGELSGDRRRWFEGLLVQLTEGIIAVDPEARISYMNPAAEALSGWTEPEAAGRPIDGVVWLLDETARRRIENPVLAALGRAAKPNAGHRALLISPHGGEIPVEVTASAIDDESGVLLGAVMVMHDVTELRRAGQVQNRLAAIVESSDDAIVSKTLDGVVLSWNPGAERLFGYTAGEMIGRPITVIFPRDRLGEETDFLQRLAKGERIEHYDTTRVRKDGAEVEISVTLSPIRDATGRIVAVSKIARDITSRKRAERDLAELLQREKQALQESLSLNRLKDEFVATLSHELRTPINAICGWANLLRSGKLSPADVGKAVDVIVRNATQQTQLIDDLMDLSAVVVGKMRLDLRRASLTAIVESAIDSIRPSVEAKDLTLALVREEGTLEVMADTDRLQQVVWNLLSNAFKFTPKGGRIEVRLEREGSLARISVADTGVGIAPEVLPAIFDRFRQGDGTTTRRHRGLGLGLAIAKHLVELHGGSIWADSDGAGCGARFTVELTLLQGHVHPIPAFAAEATGAVRDVGDLAGIRILVVDDDDESRHLVARALGLAGADVIEAASAREALGAIRRDRFEVVVSDIAMPEVDGYTLMRALRREHRRTPLTIALTAFATDEDRDRAIQAGFQAHVAKPVLPQELVREIASLLGGPRAA